MNTYEGGSLRHPHEAVIYDANGVKQVTFHPTAFNEDGSFKEDVLVVLTQITNGTVKNDA